MFRTGVMIIGCGVGISCSQAGPDVEHVLDPPPPWIIDAGTLDVSPIIDVIPDASPDVKKIYDASFDAPIILDASPDVITPISSHLYVDGLKGSNTSFCSMDRPCNTISRAIFLSPNTGVINKPTIIDLYPMEYREFLVIENKTIDIRGNGSKLMKPMTATADMTGSPLIEVYDGYFFTSVTISQLEISGNFFESDPNNQYSAGGIQCIGYPGEKANLVLDHVSILNNGGTALDQVDCRSQITQSSIVGNHSAGIVLRASELNASNSLIALNGYANGGAAISIDNSKATWNFVTIVENAYAVECDFQNISSFKNSIIWKNSMQTDQTLPSGCVATYSDIGPTTSTFLPDTHNINTDPKINASNNYRLVANMKSPVMDTADSSDKMSTDIDGLSRPIRGVPDMGASEAR